MSDDWKELEEKVDLALEHSAAELERMAAIYKRCGKRKKASEIERVRETLDIEKNNDQEQRAS